MVRGFFYYFFIYIFMQDSLIDLSKYVIIQISLKYKRCLIMNNEFWIELLQKLPSWFFAIAAIVILIGISGSIWWVIVGAKRFSDSLGKEQRIHKLQDQLDEIKLMSFENFNNASQSMIALENIQLYVNELNKLRVNSPNTDDIFQLIQRLVGSLATDIKKQAGDRNRCAVWVDDNFGFLFPVVVSTGFPDKYLDSRRLDINNSIAGKAFRKKQLINRDNVNEDDDWQQHPDSNSSYTSLICIPLDDWGVLTIDGLKPMNSNDINIGLVYSRIIEGAMVEYSNSLSSNESISSVS